jgi:ubiquinone/menaquinone biosynthesis C-methylase UbiE
MDPRTVARAIRRRLFPPQRFTPHPQWRTVEERMAKAERILDLGCGTSPHPRAGFAIDRHVGPEQRLHGEGSRIRAEVFEAQGTKLALATLESLPFPDQAFDFAYSHHVFEHLEHPERACAEMSRVARAGVVITPSVFAE